MIIMLRYTQHGRSVSAGTARLVVFVDYDGTIAEEDTFDVLVRHFAGENAWAELERRLDSGELPLREVLASQAALLRLPIDEADAYLASVVHVDPAFEKFARACKRAGGLVSIVSSGIAPLIRRMLARHGLTDVPLIANEVEVDSERGWRMLFRDPVANGTDKAERVRVARRAGAYTVFIGDGESDFDGALAANWRYAKRGRSLERFLQQRGIGYTPFSAFDELPEGRDLLLTA
jgi:HAD superfamily phosphoserine phosphatase-like hydrolase